VSGTVTNALLEAGATVVARRRSSHQRATAHIVAEVIAEALMTDPQKGVDAIRQSLMKLANPGEIEQT